jgi:hypothetical protein
VIFSGKWQGIPSAIWPRAGGRVGREQWFSQLAEGVEELRQQADGLGLEALVGDDRFTDAVVSATRTVKHAHQAEKDRGATQRRA